MIHTSQKFILAIVFLSASTAFSLSPTEVLSKSSDFFNSLNTFSLSFKVKTVYDITEEKKTYEGTLLIGQKDKFILDHKEIKLVSDGVSLWEHRKAHNQVLIKSLIDMESSFHSSEILFKYLKCEPTAVKQKNVDGKSFFVLTLNPSKQLRYLQSMEVWLDTKDYSPKRLKTVDASDNTSWYTITNFKSNQKLAKDVFTFVPDSKLELIDMR